MLLIVFINYNRRIASVSLHHNTQNVCSVLPVYVSMLRTHKYTKPRLNRTFWSSNTKLVTFKVCKPHISTKHFEFQLSNGFVRLTLQKGERLFTSSTDNCKYIRNIDWIFTAQRTIRRRYRHFLQTSVHGAQLFKILPALLHPQNSARWRQPTLLRPFTLGYITISSTPLYLSTIKTCLLNSNSKIKNQHVCHLLYARYMFCPYYDYVHEVDHFTK